MHTKTLRRGALHPPPHRRDRSRRGFCHLRPANGRPASAPAIAPARRGASPGPLGTVAVLLALASTLACGPSLDEEISLAAYLPITRPLVSTDQVVPPTGRDHATLGLGWPGSLVASRPGAHEADSGARPAGDAPWRIRGRVATFTFQLAVPGDLTLETEIRAQGDRDDPEQAVELTINGMTVARRGLDPRWSVEEFEIPGRALRVGVNEARLEFRVAERPAGAPDDVFPVSARVRWLRLASAARRPPWPDAPVGARVLATPGEEVPATPGIAMRTDSLLELAVPLPPSARLRGNLEVELARGGRRGEVHASVEVGDDSGGTQEVLRETFDVDRRAAREIDSPLEGWAGDGALLRLRVWGSANGVVRWEGLRLEHAGAPVADPLGDPDQELRPAPAGGSLVDRAPDAPRGGLPDVLVILLDAARADAFSPYGASAHTPAAARLADEGTRVVRALAPAPWTGPSVPSLLTGLQPDVHGVEIWNWPLPQELATLPQILADAGYRTLLWSHHPIWRGNRSLHRGFEILETVPAEDRDKLPDPALLVDEERPTFALVHLLIPHAPYDAPPPFRGLHADGDRRYDVSAQALNAFRRRFGERRPSSELIAQARARYAEMVAWADAQVGTLMDGLRELGRHDDTWVILTSDHGEGFYEHEQFLHSRFLYDEVLRVPLILRWPAVGPDLGRALPGPASLVDLAPTVLDGLGIGSGEVRFQGRSLLADLRGDAPSDGRAAYSVTRVTELGSQPPLPQIALERDGLKVILDQPTGRLELYDLRSDPAESRNLVDDRPLTAAELLQALLAHRKRHLLLQGRHDQAEAPFEIDEEMIESLRALGYVQ